MGLKWKEPFQFLLEKWTDLQFPSELVSMKEECCWPHSFWGECFLSLNPPHTISATCLAAQWPNSGYETWTSYELLLLLGVIFLTSVPGLKQAQGEHQGGARGHSSIAPAAADLWAPLQLWQLDQSSEAWCAGQGTLGLGSLLRARSAGQGGRQCQCVKIALEARNL